MLNLRTIGVIGKTYRHIKRYRQILTIFFKYGFGNFINALKIDQYVEFGLQMISKNTLERAEKLTQAEKVRLIFEELGPAFIKLGQILSTRPDLIPIHFTEELEKLQDNVPPFSYSEVKQIIDTEFESIENHFNDFEKQPFAAASIGQVHIARLKSNNKKVAVKIQRPGIKKIVKVDLEIMLHLATLMERHIEEAAFFHPVKIVEEFAETLEKELDYTLEASNMERVAQQVIFNSTIHIPKVFLEQTTTNVLTMEYIDGIKVSEIEKLDAKGFDKHLLTQHGADFIMMQVFEYGFFHGDLHPGNLFVLPGNVLCPVDFGMMGFIDQHTRDMFIDLIASIVMQNMSMACRYLLELTEYDEEPELRRLEKDIADFTGQYLSKSLKNINMGRLLQDLLKITFRHKLRMYPETFLMMKSFASVEGVAHILDPYFDMVKHAAPYIKHAKAARFTPKKISNDLTMASLEGIQFLQDFPRESIGVIRQLRKRQLVVGFDFKGLEKVLLTHHQVNNRISLSIIIAALIIGAALILCFKIPPLFLGISIIGIAGFILAAVLGIWFKLGN